MQVDFINLTKIRGADGKLNGTEEDEARLTEEYLKTERRLTEDYSKTMRRQTD